MFREWGKPKRGKTIFQYLIEFQFDKKFLKEWISVTKFIMEREKFEVIRKTVNV